MIFISNNKSIPGHGEELAFLFHNAPLAGYNYTEAEEKLTQQMTYWTNFARYGDPNGASGSLDWPQYTKSALHFLTPNNKVIIVCMHIHR